MKRISGDKYIELLREVEKQTGFHTFQSEGMIFTPQTADQLVFYGTSDKLEDFKSMLQDYLPTGTMAYCIDNKTSTIWSDFKNRWY